jgi:hypothetical protein
MLDDAGARADRVFLLGYHYGGVKRVEVDEGSGKEVWAGW